MGPRDTPHVPRSLTFTPKRTGFVLIHALSNLWYIRADVHVVPTR